MQRDDGIARAKLGQTAIGFGHIDFDNVHHFFAKRNVLNVSRFKVHAAASFALVHDFSQQIRHSIPHHDAPTYIRVHVQRSSGFSHDGAKRRVQVGETPTATHAQVQIGSDLHGPKHRLSILIAEIVPSRARFHLCDLISQEFLLQVGPQLKPGRVGVREHDPTHLERQLGMNRKGGSGDDSTMTDVGVIDHQVFAFPTKLDIHVLAIIVDKSTSQHRCGPSLLLHMIDGHFHETHPIHNPIQVFEIVDLGQGRSVSVMAGGGEHGLDPFDPQYVSSFLDQIVPVDARVRELHGTQPHLPLTSGQMEGMR